MASQAARTFAIIHDDVVTALRVRDISRLEARLAADVLDVQVGRGLVR